MQYLKLSDWLVLCMPFTGWIWYIKTLIGKFCFSHCVAAKWAKSSLFCLCSVNCSNNSFVSDLHIYRSCFTMIPLFTVIQVLFICHCDNISLFTYCVCHRDNISWITLLQLFSHAMFRISNNCYLLVTKHTCHIIVKMS